MPDADKHNHTHTQTHKQIHNRFNWLFYRIKTTNLIESSLLSDCERQFASSCSEHTQNIEEGLDG